MLVNLPQKILIEKSVKYRIENVLVELNLGKRCAIICDSRMQEIIGLEIKDSLKSFDTQIIAPKSIEKQYLESLSQKIKSFDFAIGIGGGKTIDITKYSSFLAKRPWMAFPTILSHDGVVSSRAAIDVNGNKVSLEAIEPIAIIADLETIQKAPYRYIAAGTGDLISNISAVEDWRIAAKAGQERYHTLIAELSLLSARSVLAHIPDIKRQNAHGMEILLWSLICSGFAMNIYGSSRPCSGSEHNFSHVLDSLNASALHGEQCALGTMISTYLQGKGWEKIKKVMIELDLPTTAEKIGIKKDVLIEALIKAKDIRDRYTILNERSITKEESEKIFKVLGIF